MFTLYDHNDVKKNTQNYSTNTTMMMIFMNPVFLLLSQILVSTFVLHASVFPGHHNPTRHSLNADKATLMLFKTGIKFDPNSTLSNWEERFDVCNFTGVKCDKHHRRVVNLSLTEKRLVGKLTSYISNLTGLRVLELYGNSFYGTIPSEFSSLRHLRHFRLEKNSLHGVIPESFSLLSNLTLVTLGDNRLSGSLPSSFFSNCTLLRNVDVSNNFLNGKIPEQIGNCPNLWNLNLYNNQFTGQLPRSLRNISLANIDVEYNNLSGQLPSDIVEHLPELMFLHLSYNNMVSHDDNTNLEPFFAALGNCSMLDELELAGMGLGGKLPPSISKLTNMTTLLLQENRIFGSFPPYIANLSSLNVLNLTSNFLNGTVSSDISQLLNLEQLFLSYNLFNTKIPEGLGKLPLLGLLDLSNNEFFGSIPESIGNLARPYSIFLNNNHLSGSIPTTLGQWMDLQKLDLSHNRLTGIIPKEILGLREIQIFLKLSHNQLEGSLPIELSKFSKVQEIDLSSNRFNGTIFPEISSCTAVRAIDFSNNFLQGNIPDTVGDLQNLEYFDVSLNRLSGQIPESLNKSLSLIFLNLSNNNFVGKVPSGGIFNSISYSSLLGNPHLCGAIIGISRCSPKKRLWFHGLAFYTIFVSVILASGFLAAICCMIGFRYMRALVSSENPAAADTQRHERTPTEPTQKFPRITHKQLFEATGGFDEQTLVGTGSYGRVYRGMLEDGTAIAVKVLQLQSGNSTKSFNRECQVLKRIRHRNLIRIITACSLPDFKALVLPYMANGSLDKRLYYPQSNAGIRAGSSDLNLIQRLNICSDIAEGMAYLHHHSPVKVIHCDLKPANVLLNDDMTALVSDFGIARLIMTVGAGNAGLMENLGNTTANLLCGSIGYIAPEYGFGSNTSTKGDVYSFGIVVLEMVTRKRPTDNMFASGISLQKWVKSHYHVGFEKVIDSSLMRASRDQPPEVRKMWDVAIGVLVELGILCTQESPSTRPTMLEAADDLDRLKRYLSGDTSATFASSLGISSSTLGDY